MTLLIRHRPPFAALGMWAALTMLGPFVHGDRARGDEIVLRSGARLEGRWINHDEEPLRDYVIHTEHGARLTLNAAQVLAAVRHPAGRAAYDRVAPSFANTAKDQWELAEWCRKRRLRKQRDFHLHRVVALDPENVRAWRALGCTQLGGAWMTRRGALESKGYVRFQGRWRLRQEVEILQRNARTREAEGEWYARLRLWRGQLFTDKRHQAWKSIAEVRDPLAIRAIDDLLHQEQHPGLKLLFVKALGRIDSPRALEVLVNAAKNNPDDEVFHASIDEIVSHKSPAVVKTFAEALKGENNARVNRAAIVLRRLGDPAALEPLVDALITTHHNVISGSIATSFSSEPSLVSLASTTSGTREPTVTPHQKANPEVLEALLELSGGVSFGFDQQAWRNWVAVYRRNQRMDIKSRRD